MTLETTCSFSREEEQFAAFRRLGDRVGLIAVSVSVVWGVHGNQSALESRESPRQVVYCVGHRASWKCCRKQRPVDGIMTHFSEEAIFISFQSELDRVGAENRNQSLFFKRTQRRICPGQDRTKSDVGQTHAASGVDLSGRPFGMGASICKSELLAVTACTGLPAVYRHSLVIEKIAAELDFFRRHGIVGGNRRERKWPRNGPVED